MKAALDERGGSSALELRIARDVLSDINDLLVPLGLLQLIKLEALLQHDSTSFVTNLHTHDGRR